MRVLLAGEGKTELGEWAKELPHRASPGDKGVLVALLEAVAARDFTIVDAIVWTRIRKYRAGDHASREERNVRGLALEARRQRCDAIVFSRDRDGDPQRERDLAAGAQWVREAHADLRLVGGVATENVEGWILLLCKHPDGEQVSGKKTKAELERRCGITTLEHKVDAVASANLRALPASSLRSWIEMARAAFAGD